MSRRKFARATEAPNRVKLPPCGSICFSEVSTSMGRSISSVVASPRKTGCGGLKGFLGLSSLLSKIPVPVSVVPFGRKNGSLKK